MITYKSDEEIEYMAEGGRRLRQVTSALVPFVKSGMTTQMVEDEAVRLLTGQHVDISFNKVKGYRWATCLPVNEQVVHTPPSGKILKDQDVLTIDIGAYFQGFHTDYATTFVVDACRDEKVGKFLQVGQRTLEKAIAKAMAGQHIGVISKEIEKNIYGNGYHVMEELTGHGVGHELHEDPFIPGFVDKPIEKTVRLKPGMVIAIEIIYSMGTEQIAYEKGNDWSIITADRSLSACFEHTVAITDRNAVILT